MAWMKYCPKCKSDKFTEEFHRDASTRSGIRSWCKQCCAIVQKERRILNPDMFRERLKESRKRHAGEHTSEHAAYQRQWRADVKQVVLTHYGKGRCACVICGESRLACLSLDHMAGNGKQESKLLGHGGGANFYSYLRRIDYPGGYQTLCMNCQWVKRFTNTEYGNWGNKNEDY